jgi:hypothetical protein
MILGKPLSPSPTGNDAQVNFRLAKAGFFRSNTYVAGHSQLTTTAQARAVNGSDNGQGKCFHAIKEILTLFNEGAHLLGGNLGKTHDVSAGNESFGRCALQYDYPHFFIVLYGIQRLIQLSNALIIQGIYRGPVQGDDSYAPCKSQFDVLKFHRYPSLKMTYRKYSPLPQGTLPVFSRGKNIGTQNFYTRLTNIL